MKKYGLQLRVQASQQRKQPTRPPLPTALGFCDDDEDDVEMEISRQAAKNKALKDIEEQHKKALEEDPSVFDYDGIYDAIKEKSARPRAQDRQERKPKYIQVLIEKAKEREREQEVVYERKLAKERSKDEHLYAGKDKFVTSAYKKKLAEQAKWMEEERIRQLREEKEDVTKKRDLSEFYFNLSKNVAYGASETQVRKDEQQDKEGEPREEAGKQQEEEMVITGTSRSKIKLPPSNSSEVDDEQRIQSPRSSKSSDSLNANAVHTGSADGNDVGGRASPNQQMQNHHKRKEDALATARERFLARKRAKEQ